MGEEQTAFISLGFEIPPSHVGGECIYTRIYSSLWKPVIVKTVLHNVII